MQEWERERERRKFLLATYSGFLLILVGIGYTFLSIYAGVVIYLGVIAILTGVAFLLIALILREKRESRRGQGR